MVILFNRCFISALILLFFSFFLFFYFLFFGVVVELLRA